MRRRVGLALRWLVVLALWSLLAYAVRVVTLSSAPPWAPLAMMILPLVLVVVTPRQTEE